MVAVTGVDDSEPDGDVAYTVVTAAATSGDSNYSGLNAADVVVTNADDDPPSGPTPGGLYVWDIVVEGRLRGKGGSIHDARLHVTIRSDSDGDGIAEATDETWQTHR